MAEFKLASGSMISVVWPVDPDAGELNLITPFGSQYTHPLTSSHSEMVRLGFGVVANGAATVIIPSLGSGENVRIERGIGDDHAMFSIETPDGIVLTRVSEDECATLFSEMNQ